MRRSLVFRSGLQEELIKPEIQDAVLSNGFKYLVSSLHMSNKPCLSGLSKVWLISFLKYRYVCVREIILS